MSFTIKATVQYDDQFWSVIFERTDGQKLSVAKTIFGKEPSDPEIYQYIAANLGKIKFSAPVDFTLVIKRKNPKRIQREIKAELNKLKTLGKKETLAQETIRLAREKDKQTSRKQSRLKKRQIAQVKFELRTQKRKQKAKGR